MAQDATLAARRLCTRKPPHRGSGRGHGHHLTRGSDVPKGTPGKPPCKHPDGCPRPHYGGGWCSLHWKRAKDNDGDPGPVGPLFVRGAHEICTVDGCDRPHEAKGKCTLHYGRERLGREIPPEVTDGRVRERGPCKVDGCPKVSATSDLCATHYARWKKDPSDLGPAVGRKPPRMSDGAVRVPTDPFRRVLAAAHIPDTLGACWEHRSPDPTTGYARVHVTMAEGFKVRRGAHVVVSEHFDGPVPTGWQVDHLCYNRGCVNPSHLEQVPPGVNQRRAYAKRKAEQKATH